MQPPLTIDSLAKRLGHKSMSTVGAIVSPSNDEPFRYWREAESWADALELARGSRERDEFFELVILEAAPRYLVEIFRRLSAKTEEQEQEIRAVKDEFLNVLRQIHTPDEGTA